MAVASAQSEMSLDHGLVMSALLEKIDWKLFVPWVLTLLTVSVGIWQYADKQAQTNRDPFLRKQLEVMFSASAATAQLATLRDPAEWMKARDAFWLLYTGPMVLVEDPKVAAAMIAFGKAVDAAGLPPDTLPRRELLPLSIDISVAARSLILKSWQVDIPALHPDDRPNGSTAEVNPKGGI